MGAMRRRISAPIAAVVVALVVGTAACGSDDATTTPELRAGSVSVMSNSGSALIVSAVEPIKLGKNDLGVAAGAGIEVVKASALMPAHGHSTNAPTIEHTPQGDYVVRQLVLYMSGRWEVRFALRRNGADDEALVTVDVP